MIPFLFLNDPTNFRYLIFSTIEDSNFTKNLFCLRLLIMIHENVWGFIQKEKEACSQYDKWYKLEVQDEIQPIKPDVV